MTSEPIRSYFIGDELDPLQLWWLDGTGALIDFSVEHTFEAKLLDPTRTQTIFTSTSGFAGAAGSGTETSGTPNLAKSWPTSGELNAVTKPGRYLLQIKATRVSDSRERTMHMLLAMKARY